MTQAQEILKALQCGRRLTPLDALNDFGCFRLGARIHELKGMGYPTLCCGWEREAGEAVLDRELINLTGE
jgi:hypothetical protein